MIPPSFFCSHTGSLRLNRKSRTASRSLFGNARKSTQLGCSTTMAFADPSLWASPALPSRPAEPSDTMSRVAPCRALAIERSFTPTPLTLTPSSSHSSSRQPTFSSQLSRAAACQRACKPSFSLQERHKASRFLIWKTVKEVSCWQQ